MPILDLSAKHAMNLLIQPLRQLANTKRRVLATKLVLPAISGTSMVHVEPTSVALLDHHAADLAIEVIEDIVEVSTLCVAGNAG
jgi:hypothetical protein